jgi:hypothetical protein
VFVRINGDTRHLRRAVDHRGEVLEVFATKHLIRRKNFKENRSASLAEWRRLAA